MSPALMQYCERHAAQFWAEPLNALTNLAFLLAAGLMAMRLRGRTGRRELWLLVALTAAIGTGSFLWHTLAVPWAAWADVIPIGLFISVFLVVFLRRVPGLAWPVALSVFLLFLALNAAVVAKLPGDSLNGSVFYLPTLLMLFALAAGCRVAAPRRFPRLLAMAVIFAVSLLLRTVDMAVCPAFPWGTHFAWHLLNAGLLYLAMRVLDD